MNSTRRHTQWQGKSGDETKIQSHTVNDDGADADALAVLATGDDNNNNVHTHCWQSTFEDGMPHCLPEYHRLRVR